MSPMSTSLLLGLFLLLHLGHVSAASLQHDGETLLALKRHFLDPRGSLDDWNPQKSPCRWFGVSCSNWTSPSNSHKSPVLQETAWRPARVGRGSLRVAELVLSDCGLSGNLSADVGRLDALLTLDLSHNLLSGAIPSQAWQLPNLQVLKLNGNNFAGKFGQDGRWIAVSGLRHLDLSDNHLGGSVPSFSQFYNLTHLSLASNYFGGAFPSNVFPNAISHLDLSENSFAGSLPTLSPLPRLRYLNISKNALEGQIPTNLPEFAALTSLDMSSNRFSGQIPTEVGGLAQLQILTLGDNRLNGSIPAELGKCKGLLHLNLAYGNGLSGGIPLEFGQLKNLKTLHSSGNLLTGPIPRELGSVAGLQVLALDDNRLSGSIPSELGRLSNLEIILLNRNGLSGEIPTSLVANSRKLVHLDFSDNQLSGIIPAEMGLLSILSTLNLQNNWLTGEMPSSLMSCKNLEVLDLTGNLLTGGIPSSFGGKGSRLQILRLGHNSLSGDIPEQLGATPGLSVLDLSNNSLQGNIPPSVGDANNLTYLFLHHNRLTGVIPKELGNLHMLQELDLSHNVLQGRIPAELSSLTQLNQLFLGCNNLSGTIPVTLSKLVSLQSLHLEGNALTGVIPRELSGCQGLRRLSLHGNQLTGSIPKTFGSFPALQELLDLSFNNLTGTIPSNLKRLVQLEALNVTHNQLSGPIPSFLLELGDTASLVELNLSYNLFTGKIPQTGFTRNLTASSFEGNEGLCGLPLAVPCRSSGDARPEAGRDMIQSTPTVVGVVVAVASLTVTLVLSIVAVVCVGKSSCPRRPDVPAIKTHSSRSVFRGSMSWRVWDRNLTFWDIMAATDELNEDRRIGFGKCGTVYKAVMPDGEILAVKVFQHMPEQLDKNATYGIVDLCKVRHRHLLRLLGFCSHKGRNLLIYEYMANGSLWDHLHGSSYVALSGPYNYLSSPEQAGKVLDWPLRYEIALGAAKAICYLHNDCIPRIIHGNIKSTNILLDTHMLPYVCDYGLAALQGFAAFEPTSSLSSRSCGYLSPEYNYTKQGSEESDVYSFGVVLMELITGKTPADSSFPDGISNIVAWLRYCRASRAQIARVLDSNLQTFISDSERYEMLLVLKIAYMCTKDMPSERPSMRIVLNLLKELKRQTMTAGECCALFASKTLADILK